MAAAAPSAIGPGAQRVDGRVASACGVRRVMAATNNSVGYGPGTRGFTEASLLTSARPCLDHKALENPTDPLPRHAKRPALRPPGWRIDRRQLEIAELLLNEPCSLGCRVGDATLEPDVRLPEACQDFLRLRVVFPDTDQMAA